MIEWHLEKRNISDLIDYSRNPRCMTKNQVSDLQISLSEFGLIDKPIINLDNTIIGGHQRLKILKKNKVKEVDCWVPSHLLDPSQVSKLCLRLNKNTADWDWDVLANEWDMQDLLEIGFDASDFNEDLVDELPKKPRISITFDNHESLEIAMPLLERLENCEIKVKNGKGRSS